VDLAATFREISRASAAFVVAIITNIIIIMMIIIIYRMLEKFNNQRLHDKFYLIDQTTEGWIICWSYDTDIWRREKNIYKFIVGKHANQL
jgi:hypothetical protein